VIVRISGTGQFDIDDDCAHRLDTLDDDLTGSLHAGNEQGFHQALAAIIELVQGSGKPVENDRVVPSDVIVPPEDITLDEAQRFFTDEGLMQPLPA
jgi:hypothetical protein